MPILNRRTLLISTASLALTASLPLRAETLPPIHVAKGTGCECCTAWVDHLRAEGFTVTEEELYGMLLINYKLDNGNVGGTRQPEKRRRRSRRGEVHWLAVLSNVTSESWHEG